MRLKDDEELIKSEVKRIAETYKLNAVYLFGSFARGEEVEGSDVDLVIHDEGSTLKGFVSFIQLEMEFEGLFQRKVDLLTLSQIRRGDASYKIRFQENFERDKVVLYEK